MFCLTSSNVSHVKHQAHFFSFVCLFVCFYIHPLIPTMGNLPRERAITTSFLGSVRARLERSQLQNARLFFCQTVKHRNKSGPCIRTCGYYFCVTFAEYFYLRSQNKLLTQIFYPSMLRCDSSRYGNSCCSETDEKANFDHKLKRCGQFQGNRSLPFVGNFHFNWYTPRPKKLFRASLSTICYIHNKNVIGH